MTSRQSESTSRFSVTKAELFDTNPANQPILSWASGDSEYVLKGTSDFQQLNKFKNALLNLRADFLGNQSGRIVLESDKRQDFNRRLLLLEHEIQGLLKKKINYSVRDKEGNSRSLDYTIILNEKQNQIIELQKKIQNYEERLRKSTSHELELQNHIVNLTVDLKRQQQIIKNKNDTILAEYSYSKNLKDTLFKIKRNCDTYNNADLIRIAYQGITWPAFQDINAELLLNQSKSRNIAINSDQAIRGQIVTVFRECQRLLSSNNINQNQLDNIFEGAIQAFGGSKLRQTIDQRIQRMNIQESYRRTTNNFNSFIALVNQKMNQIRQKYPNDKSIVFDSNILQILRSEKIDSSITANGMIQIQSLREKTIEVPVQDARTKHLVHLLSIQMKKLVEKYPKLTQQIDNRLLQFLKQQIIDLLEVDQLDRVVQIVKFVPQTVKVQNVYAYSSQKSKRIQFHLRVLIKALLQQLQKLKRKSGLVLDLDQGIVAMINQEIMGVVDIDDILKVFRVVPKIVEVEKIVQKIVQRVVEIPQVIPVERIVEKVIEVTKIQQVERVVNVPVQIIKYVDNYIQKIVIQEVVKQIVVQVPKIIQKIVQVKIQVPKIQQVQVMVDRIIQVEVPIIQEKIINHFVPQIKEVERIVQKLVPVETIIKQSVPVEVYIEKIVPQIQQITQLVQIEKVVQKIVQVIKYVNVTQVINQIQTRIQIVQKIIRVPVPIIQTVQKIVEVPQIIQKIVQVVIQKPVIHQIKIFEDKIIYVDKIKQVQKIVNHTVQLIKQVPKIIQQRIEVPIIQQKIKLVPQIITQIVVERHDVVKIMQVQRFNEKIIQVAKIVEVEKLIPYYITENVINKIVVEKIVEVPRTIQRIKEVRVNVDKIIQKMVEVPKVVEVQKIVQKIVVIPRVVQKIVEIPQIVEKIVDRIVEVQKIKIVQTIIQVPIVTEKIVQIQVPKNIYVQVQKIVERIVERIVPVQKQHERVVIVQKPVQKIVQKRVEVPKQIQVQKVVLVVQQVEHVVQIDKPTILPVQIKVPVDRIIQKLVPVYRDVEKIVSVPQLVQKIVQVKVEQIQQIEFQTFIDKIAVQTQIKQVEKVIPYYNERIKQIQVISEKIIPVTNTVEVIQPVQFLVEKMSTNTVQTPKVYQIQKLVQKLIEVPKIVEVEVITPVIVKVNQVIQSFRDRIIQIDLIRQQLVNVQVLQQKVVAINTNHSKIQPVQIYRDRNIQVEKLIIKTDIKNRIQDQLKVVDRFEEKLCPVVSTVQRIVQVPHILQKIVEKIVIMPQVVECIKYIHQITQQVDLGIAVGIDITVQQQRYKQLYSNIKLHFDNILMELRKLRMSRPEFKAQIQIIQSFLVELNKLAAFQRIVQVQKQKIVQKERNVPILVPTRDNISIRNQISLSLLTQKLLLQLKRIKRENSNLKLNLDDQILLAFFSDFVQEARRLPEISQQMQSKLQKYILQTNQRLTSLSGQWSLDNEQIITHVFQQKLSLANLIRESNYQINKLKAISQKRLQTLEKLKRSNTLSLERFAQIENTFNNLISNLNLTQQLNQISSLMKEYSKYIGNISNQYLAVQEPIRLFGEISTFGNQSYDRIESLYRQKIRQVELLKQRLLSIQSKRTVVNVDDQSRMVSKLRNQITALSNQLVELKSQASVNINITASSQQYQIKIRTLNSRIQQLESQLRTIRIQSDGHVRNAKNQSQKALREAQLKIKESERKITNYQRQIESLNTRLAQMNVLSKSQFTTTTTEPRSQTKYEPKSENKDNPQGVSNILETARFSSATKQSYTPGQYSSSGSGLVNTPINLTSSSLNTVRAQQLSQYQTQQSSSQSSSSENQSALSNYASYGLNRSPGVSAYTPGSPTSSYGLRSSGLGSGVSNIPSSNVNPSTSNSGLTYVPGQYTSFANYQPKK